MEANKLRTMGLDVGTKTVGIAVSDPFGWTAQGVETIPVNTEEEEYGLERLDELVRQYEVTRFVVGYPKNMNNTVGPRGEASEAYAELLKERYGHPVELWDERLSTVAAERTLLEADMSRKKRAKVIDKMAAVMILQGYLDSKS